MKSSGAATATPSPMKLAPRSHLSEGLEKTGSIEKMKTVRQEPPTIKVKMYLRSITVNI
jgi:hypothetical protein